MNEFKGTPGPWHTPGKANCLGGYTVFHGHGESAHNQICQADVLADASLIAAAPELLAALKAFVEPWSLGGYWQSKITYDTYNAARKAIAKATS